MKHLLISVLLTAGLLLLAPFVLAQDGPPMTRAGVWYRSLQQTEPVTAGEGYFCLRLVQAQIISSRPGWFSSLFTGDRGTRQIFACMQFAYGDTGVQAPIAWGEITPEKPLLPQNRVQVTPWLPVVTRAGAPLQPNLSVILRSVPLTSGGILSALHLLADRASSAGPLSTFAQTTDVIFTFQDLFEQIFGSFTPQATTPTGVTFDLASGGELQQVRFSKYLLITDADAKLQRTRAGKTETFRWDEWEQRLAIPGEGSTSPYVTWRDTGEPVREVSFLLFEISTLPRFFRDFESVHAAPGLYKTIYKLVVMPLTSALEGQTEEPAIAATLRMHLDQLREWLWNEQPGISMRDIETICKVVADKALTDSGARLAMSTKFTTLEDLPGAQFPEEPRPDQRPSLHQITRWKTGG